MLNFSPSLILSYAPHSEQVRTYPGRISWTSLCMSGGRVGAMYGEGSLGPCTEENWGPVQEGAGPQPFTGGGPGLQPCTGISCGQTDRITHRYDGKYNLPTSSLMGGNKVKKNEVKDQLGSQAIYIAVLTDLQHSTVKPSKALNARKKYNKLRSLT